MARGWLSTFKLDSAIWGEYQGTVPAPYQVAIDVLGPRFRCSCPSPRLPCKHASDLLTRFRADPSTFVDAVPPEAVSQWLESRKPRAERQQTPEELERAAADQRKRLERREQRISNGIEELDRWLRDLVRGGLAEVPSRSRASFDQMAARLVDAQAPGLARLVRELAYLPYSGNSQWPERMLIVIGRLQLLLDAWRRRDAFEPDLQAELRAQVGINESRDSVLAKPPVRDTWSFLGRRTIVDERFVIQRTWLWGETVRRWALVLEFTAGMAPVQPVFAPGTQLQGELCFYSGTHPLRAIPRGELMPCGPVSRPPTQPMHQALVEYARALASNPWLERFPLVLGEVTPVGTERAWFAQDQDGRQVALTGPHGWRLLAISGGHPIDVVAEWDGYALQPLAAMADGAFVALPTPVA